MRSAEASGVEAGGFVAAKNRASRPRGAFRSRLRRMASRLRAFLTQVSPASIAVALTALSAATLFVAFDAARSLNDARMIAGIAARTLGAELAALDPDQAAIRLLVAARTLEPGYRATLRGPGRQLLASSELSLDLDDASVLETPVRQGRLRTEFSLGSLGALSVSTSEANAMGPVRLRAAFAFGLAALATGLAYRRRPGVPNRKDRQGFEDLIATIPFGVACWTDAGALVVCNSQYRQRLRLEGGELAPGTSYQSIVRQISLGGYMRMVNDDEANRILELHREDESCLLIDERPLAGGGFVTLISDVTERKRTDLMLTSIREEQRMLARRYHEEKLRAEAASRSKTSFLRHLSHDIRTPLNHIIGFADLIRHETYGPLGDARYLTYIETIKTSGERLLSSFATILDLAELEGGQKTLREDPVAVDRLIDACVDRFKAQAARAGLTFVVGGPCDAVLIADSFCLQRMLGNIIDNAIRYTPAGGRVTLAAHAAADGVVLEVSDTGLGMDDERLANLSQPFVFGDSAFTREHGGAGLGIAIARTIAELSGGHLAIDSSPTLGTTVAISLPLKAASAGRVAAE